MSTTERRHTPGPWKILRRSWPMTIKGNIHQIADGDNYPAAFVPAWDDPALGEEDGAEEAVANAHLISAAPDLLDLLLTAGDADSSNDDVRTSWWEARAAAIAKAEGRA